MPPMRTASFACRSSLLVALTLSCAPRASAPADTPVQPVPRKKKLRPTFERPPPAVEKPVVEARPPASSEPPLEKSPTATEATQGEATDSDIVRANATSVYLSRLNAFFRRGFKCEMFPARERASCKPTGEVQIDSNGVVEAFTVTPCTSSAAINAAATATLRDKVGQPLPPPPPELPALNARSLRVRFACAIP